MPRRRWTVARAAAFYELLLDRLAPSALLYVAVVDGRRVEELAARGVVVETPPHRIFGHEDDTLGPAGHEEWQAFDRDSEGNLVGLVSRCPA